MRRSQRCGCVCDPLHPASALASPPTPAGFVGYSPRRTSSAPIRWSQQRRQQRRRRSRGNARLWLASVLYRSRVYGNEGHIVRHLPPRHILACVASVTCIYIPIRPYERHPEIGSIGSWSACFSPPQLATHSRIGGDEILASFSPEELPAGFQCTRVTNKQYVCFAVRRRPLVMIYVSYPPRELRPFWGLSAFWIFGEL